VRRLLVACALVVSACGVGSQDTPQIIEEESTRQPPPGTPSFDTDPSPASPSSSAPPITTMTTSASPAPSR
jgi:hypothetical protein